MYQDIYNCICQNTVLVIKKSEDHAYGISQYWILDIKRYLGEIGTTWVTYENMNKGNKLVENSFCQKTIVLLTHVTIIFMIV